MKLSNIFKKETKKSSKVNVQKMDKNQLSKVIGGGDGEMSFTSTGKAITVKMGGSL